MEGINLSNLGFLGVAPGMLEDVQPVSNGLQESSAGQTSDGFVDLLSLVENVDSATQGLDSLSEDLGGVELMMLDGETQNIMAQQALANVQLASAWANTQMHHAETH